MQLQAFLDERCHVEETTEINTYLLMNCLVVKYAEFVTDHMYDFMQWLVDRHAYNYVLSCDNSNKDNICVLSICHQLIALTQNCKSPVTLRRKNV